ncbi:MAG: TonB-dependent receptor [Limnohabitans sp.]
MKLFLSPVYAMALSVAAVHMTGVAQTIPTSNPAETVITAGRIPQDPFLLPQGVTVITADEILASGVTNANEAIRTLGGVIGRIDTSGGRNQTLDLRGFGETASNNVVILIDGVRQNEGDSGSANLAWIPLSSIERIEIARGSGSVMHGDGATAGVINVITNKGIADPGGSLGMSVGSFGTREARFSLGTREGAWRFQAHAGRYQTDNHRDNFAREENNALVRATWAEGSTQWSFQLGAQDSKGRLPGGLTVQDFRSQPRKTYYPDDHGSTRSSQALLSGEFSLSDWRVGLEWNQRWNNMESVYVRPTYTYTDASDSNAQRLGLRSWREYRSNDVVQKLVFGWDAENWSQNRNGGSSLLNQTSRALYARHELNFVPRGWTVHAGARRTLAQREITGIAVGMLDMGNTSWELGSTLQMGNGAQAFARTGTSFRLATIDEFACYPYPGYSCPTDPNRLRPQTSRDYEFGYRKTHSAGKWSARYYRNDLTNEIGYDGSANVNFDPTRRDGLELDVHRRLSAYLDASVQVAHRQAVFRSGPNEGRDVPLVPRDSLTARMSWRVSSSQQFVLSGQWVAQQRITGDWDNACTDRIPSYGVLNLRYHHRVERWTYAATINNLTDHSYYNYRSRCSPTAKSVYPEAGRALCLSAQRQF